MEIVFLSTTYSSNQTSASRASNYIVACLSKYEIISTIFEMKTRQRSQVISFALNRNSVRALSLPRWRCDNA